MATVEPWRRRTRRRVGLAGGAGDIWGKFGAVIRCEVFLDMAGPRGEARARSGASAETVGRRSEGYYVSVQVFQ